MRVAIGDATPALSLPDEHGREVSLPARGAPTVLIFYRGDW